MCWEVIGAGEVDVDGEVEGSYSGLHAEDVDLLEAQEGRPFIAVQFLGLLTDDGGSGLVVVGDEVGHVEVGLLVARLSHAPVGRAPGSVDVERHHHQFVVVGRAHCEGYSGNDCDCGGG